jgi:transposase
MRPSGTPAQLAARRERALALLAQGYGPTAVARAVGASRSTIYEWRDEAQGKPTRRSQRAGGPLGRPRRLNGKQLKRLEKALLKGAYVHGYPDDAWTLDRIGQVIWRLFGVRYSPSGVWRVMQHLGWSSQKQQRQAVQRDEA